MTKTDFMPMKKICCRMLVEAGWALENQLETSRKKETAGLDCA